MSKPKLEACHTGPYPELFKKVEEIADYLLDSEENDYLDQCAEHDVDTDNNNLNHIFKTAKIVKDCMQYIRESK
jgi:hypothetical protein